MKIIKIADSETSIYGSSEKHHYYAVFNKRGSKQKMAIQLTHIARESPNKVEKANNGIIGHIRLKKLSKYCDSGITHDIYSTLVGGKPITYNSGQIVIDNVSKYSERKIKTFAFSNPRFVSYRNTHKKVNKMSNRKRK